MYRLAVKALCDNLPYFLFSALVLTAIDALGFQITYIVTVVLAGIFARSSHRMILLDETYSWSGRPRVTRPNSSTLLAFLLRYGLLILLHMLIVTVILYPVLQIGESRGTSLGVLLALANTIAWPVIGIALALFGTMLPAVAVGLDSSFTKAFSRGRKRFLITLTRLFVGPGAFTIGSLIATFVLFQIADSVVPMLAKIFILYFTLLIPIHLTAVTLSLAFFEAEAMGS